MMMFEAGIPLWVFLQLLGSAALTASAASQCEPVKVSLCRAMPWNMTRMPNLLHFSTQRNVELALGDFQPLVDTGCSRLLPFFLCAMYAPMCTGQLRDDAVPPCRNVCEAARRGCEPVARAHNRSWPRALACEHLPRYETSVCVTPESFVTTLPKEDHRDDQTQSVLNKLPDCKCDARRQKLKWRIYEKKHFAYALKATYRGAQGIKGGPLIVTIHVDSVLKNSSVRIAAGRDLTLWVGTECICPLLQEGDQYLVLGREDPINRRLLYDDTSLALPWEEKWPNSIRKWERRLLKRDKTRKPVRRRRKGKGGRRGRNKPRPVPKPSDPPRRRKARKQNAKPQLKSNCNSKNCPKRRKGRLKGKRNRRERSRDKLSRARHRHDRVLQADLLDGAAT